MAYYIGRISREAPTAFFHIISKDTGFDILIAHLKSKEILAARHKEVADIPLLEAANSKTLAEKVDVVLTNVRQRGAARPRTVKTLSSTIGSLFQNQLGEGDIKTILTEINKSDVAVIDGNKGDL